MKIIASNGHKSNINLKEEVISTEQDMKDAKEIINGFAKEFNPNTKTPDKLRSVLIVGTQPTSFERSDFEDLMRIFNEQTY